jgi:transposase
MNIINQLTSTHASENTKYHCLYMYFFQGISVSDLAKYFLKHHSTIREWIYRYENGEGVSLKSRYAVYKNFGLEKRVWIVDLYRRSPVLYLEEAKLKFIENFNASISASTICIILKESGLTWKVLERRALQIKIDDVSRFCSDLINTPWILENLLFLYEVSLDNRGMLRRKGYGFVGQKLVYRGEFNR